MAEPDPDREAREIIDQQLLGAVSRIAYRRGVRANGGWPGLVRALYDFDMIDTQAFDHMLGAALRAEDKGEIGALSADTIRQRANLQQEESM